MPDIHARLSASGAKKWINCPGSIQLEENFEDKPSEFAQEGTNAHALGEAKIRLATKEYNRTKYHNAIRNIDITEDMEDYAEGYKNFVIERYNSALRKTPDAILMLEQRLDFSNYVPDGFGTGDAVIIANGKLEIIDLKYGKGVEVSAVENPQLRLYALGAYEAFDMLYGIENVTMTIYQPRLDNISSESITAAKLLEWGETVKKAAQLANDDSVTDCIAGSHCDTGFCKARPACRAYTAEKQRLAVYDFKAPALLTTEEIADVLDQSAAIKKWAELVSDYALDQAYKHGVQYPGFKVVEGRSNRKYSKPDAEVAKILTDKGYSEDDIMVSKIKGITDIERLLGKKTFSDILGPYIMKPPGKPTLVHSEDKRPAISSAEQAQEDFKNDIN
nr:MAG TPA: PD-(D/E)XK nuclease superfamily protein [Caudoviricetes sp.]